jgi:hypothetical protein
VKAAFEVHLSGSSLVRAERLESASLCRCPFLLTPVEFVASMSMIFVLSKAAVTQGTTESDEYHQNCLPFSGCS